MATKKKVKKVEALRLDLLEDGTHKLLWSGRFSRTSLIVTIISFLVVIGALFYVLMAFTPLRTTIPGYPNAQSRRAAVQAAIKVDSLERIIGRWELYSENLRRVLEGEDAVKIDSMVRAAASTDVFDAELLRQRDSLLRQNVRKEEQFDLSTQKKRLLPIEGMHFFTPIKGVISQGFDKVTHPYVDITAPANSMVMAVLDGTVFFAGWNEESGYTIQIQHENDIVSIYKHNSKLLKKSGDKITAGSPVAIVGGTGELSTGDHLHFELWYKGEAVNPTEYINF
ncbi:MAG: M23 family metallopeptidase [Candidatus Cryptobacteroides sp.]